MSEPNLESLTFWTWNIGGFTCNEWVLPMSLCLLTFRNRKRPWPFNLNSGLSKIYLSIYCNFSLRALWHSLFKINSLTVGWLQGVKLTIRNLSIKWKFTLANATNKLNHIIFYYSVHSTKLSSVKSAKYLGVNIDSSLREVGDNFIPGSLANFRLLC